MGESSTDQHSLEEKVVIPPPPRPPPHASLGDEFHKKNEPFTPIVFGEFCAIGTSAVYPDVMVSPPVWLVVKRSEEDEPVAPKSYSFKFLTFAASHELPERRGEEEILKYKLRVYPVFEVLEHGKASVQAPKDPNGSFALQGGTPLMTGIDPVKHGRPLLMEGIDSHRINMPPHAEHDSPGRKFPKGEGGQNLHGKVAILCTSVSAQTILGLAGGPGAMNLPKPILYSAAAANAIAFGGSALALLLIKKKPYAASILARVGFASTIATFLLTMGAFIYG